MSARTHSRPPVVEVDVEGPNRDLAVIVLDLEPSAIAASIVRDLTKARAGQGIDDGDIERTVLATRPTFRLEFTPAAAAELRDALSTALDAAEIECVSEGCTSIAVIDGHCAADDERLDVRRGA